jgi:hypothetical protein
MVVSFLCVLEQQQTLPTCFWHRSPNASKEMGADRNVNSLLLPSYHWIALLRLSCHPQLRYGVFETQARSIVLSIQSGQNA